MSLYVRDWQWGTQYLNFKKSEFKCPKYCNGYGNGIASSLVNNLQILRNKYGSVDITSGYRCVKYNSTLKGASANSWHLRGQASDFKFTSGILNSQNKRIEVVNEISQMQNVHYVYCNINNNHPNMGTAIHMDCYLNDIDVMKLQETLNIQYGTRLSIDGSFGELTYKECMNNYLCLGKKAPTHIKWMQQQLLWRGYDIGDEGCDGSFGFKTEKALKQFQKDKGLVPDGKCGAETTKKMVFE